jgi:dTMP kinase
MKHGRESLFITLEGIEGVGKSTHLEFISTFVQGRDHKVCVTREPGGTRLGESIREILLHGTDLNISADVELLLMFAARSQHIHEVIRPALEGGQVVICDRFTDASYAYQGAGRGIDVDEIRKLETWVQKGLKPDLTLLFDASVDTGFKRITRRGDKDRFEAEDKAFFEAIRGAYLERANAEPDRVKVIDAEKSIPEVQEQIKEVLETIF